VEQIDISHLAGTFDIGGNLTVNVVKKSDYSIGYMLRPICRMVIPGGENNPLMGKYMEYMDDNHIKFSLTDPEQDGDHHRIEITRRQDIPKFINPMLEYLVVQYRTAIFLLDEVLPRMDDGMHQTKEGFYELMEYVDVLRNPSRQKSRMKYTQEYFENEWSVTQ